MNRVLACLALAAVLAAPAWAEVRCSEDLEAVDSGAASRMTAQDFAREVLAKEADFAKALANFGYKTEAVVETLDGDTVDGAFRQVSTLGFDANGPRREVADGAVDTLTRIKFADRDLDTLRDAFTLTADRVATGDIVYSGRQRTGQFNASLFDILPRDPSADVRGFQGRVWVRGREDSIMRLCGRSAYTPIAPMRFLVVRELVAEQYWFPVLIRADEDARIGKVTVHVRLTVTYSDYKAR
ncbi:MAG: hypothetical protein J0J01_10010 [Reyranella sp.]|uniref:hypothetical protein n=1 Tax=Reyranella sp. TaxID=1929291 RepID=UPI001ACDFA81|nr:hypothetical protein [Reyranella sp.]MBN9087229.1 hypothetical protein [Reyranella sp.]